MHWMAPDPNPLVLNLLIFNFLDRYEKIYTWLIAQLYIFIGVR